MIVFDILYNYIKFKKIINYIYRINFCYPHLQETGVKRDTNIKWHNLKMNIIQIKIKSIVLKLLFKLNIYKKNDLQKEENLKNYDNT